MKLFFLGLHIYKIIETYCPEVGLIVYSYSDSLYSYQVSDV